MVRRRHERAVTNSCVQGSRKGGGGWEVAGEEVRRRCIGRRCWQERVYGAAAVRKVKSSAMVRGGVAQQQQGKVVQMVRP